MPHAENCNATLAEPCPLGTATKAENDHMELHVGVVTLIKTVKWKVICDPAALQGATHTLEASYGCLRRTGFRKTFQVD